VSDPDPSRGGLGRDICGYDRHASGARGRSPGIGGARPAGCYALPPEHNPDHNILGHGRNANRQEPVDDTARKERTGKTGSIRSRTCIRRLAVTWLPTPNRSYSTLRWRAPLNQSSASIVAGRQTTVKAGLRPPPSAADGPDSGLPSSPCWPPSVRWPGMNGFGKSDGAGLAVAPPIFDPAPDRRGFRQPSTRAKQTPPA